MISTSSTTPTVRIIAPPLEATTPIRGICDDRTITQEPFSFLAPTVQEVLKDYLEQKSCTCQLPIVSDSKERGVVISKVEPGQFSHLLVNVVELQNFRLLNLFNSYPWHRSYLFAVYEKIAEHIKNQFPTQLPRHHQGLIHALWHAYKNSNLDISSGLAIINEYQYSLTPLMWAVLANDPWMVWILVGAGAPVHGFTLPQQGDYRDTVNELYPVFGRQAALSASKLAVRLNRSAIIDIFTKLGQEYAKHTYKAKL